MMKKIIFALLTSYGLVTYCQKAHKVGLTHFKQYENDKNQSIYFADFDASRRGTIIIQDLSDAKKPVRILSEPPPDAILAFTSTLSNSLNIKNEITASQSATFNQTIRELTKRSTTIVVLRDALYRLNEYDFNNPGKIADSSYFKKFDRILDLAKEINDKELEEVQVEVKEKENENLNLKAQLGVSTSVPIYFQITKKELKDYSNKIVSNLVALGYNAEGSEYKNIDLKLNQLRYFHDDDKEKAENLKKELESLGLKDVNIINNSKFKELKDRFEVWITKN